MPSPTRSAHDRLQHYRARRDFDKTPEPVEDARKPSKATEQRIYVVQRHHASHLHYDFRLEFDGVLKSWAIPKGPSLDPDIKRLAVEVEDHPLGYASFEGQIPSGQYGAGHVRIWDSGTWQPKGDVRNALETGRLHFRLTGEQLAGEWVLIRTGKSRQWLLRKIQDAFAQPGHDAEHAPPSDAADFAHSPTPRSRSRAARAAPSVAPPDTLSPQLATLVDRPPDAAGWRYEIKYDGYRMLCRLHQGKAQLMSRNGLSWERRSPAMQALASALAKALPGDGWLDGELVVFDHAGHSHFSALQSALGDERTPEDVLHYVIFDLPWWAGKDLRDDPFSARRATLEKLAPTFPAHVQLSALLPGDGETVWQAACNLALEGVIGKQVDAPYVGRRSTSWIKIKCRPRGEFVIGGWTEPKGQRSGFGALLLGVWEQIHGKRSLRYVGRVGTGFKHAQLVSLHAQLQQNETRRSPFSDLTKMPGETVHWSRPTLVAEVKFTSWTNERHLRQASFSGLREDKSAREIAEEVPMEASALSSPTTPRRRTSTKPAVTTAPHGIRISNAERVVFPDAGLTKGQLADYYASVAQWLVPWLKGRPLSLMRCPEGTQRTCFFQKHWAQAQRLPHGLARIEVPDEEAPYIVVTSVPGIIALVQHGVIELHQWGASLPRLDRPDRITFDLDPDPSLGWKSVAEAAQLVKTTLEEFNLPSFLHSTGGKGLHVVVPLRRTRSWDEVKEFSRGVALYLSGLMPDRFTASMSKSQRKGRIFIDYLRNTAGNTAIVPYAVRARAGAPVAMPLSWDVLRDRQDIRGDHFNIRNAARYLKEHATLWDEFQQARANLSVRHVRLMART
jgi:bifunctional non-homologous end joining protein LigD